MSRRTRIALIVVGVLALLTGAIWVGQGLGLIPGSVMTGDRLWFYIGLMVGFGGIVLLAFGLRKSKTPPSA